MISNENINAMSPNHGIYPMPNNCGYKIALKKVSAQFKSLDIFNKLFSEKKQCELI